MAVVILVLLVVGISAWALRPKGKASRPRFVATVSSGGMSLVLAVLAVVLQVNHKLQGNTSVSDASNSLFMVGLVLILAAIAAAIGLALAHRGEAAKGLGLGACIAVVASIGELALLGWLGGV